MRKIFPKSVALSTVIAASAFFLTFQQHPLFADEVNAQTQNTSFDTTTEEQMMAPGMQMGRLMMPIMDSAAGQKLFVNKGCVACHSVNGVGGEDAPELSASEMDDMMNPFDFAAKMWNHAPGMIAAQEEELGGQITFTGQELADIIAFIHNDKIQHGFTENSLPEQMREMMEMHNDDGHGEEAESEHHEENEDEHSS